MQCLGVVRKANRIMDCINRGSEPKSKDVILLLYGLILSLYKELAGANQTRCTAGLITLSSEAYCPGQSPVHSLEDESHFSKEGNGTRGVGFSLHSPPFFFFFALRYNAKLCNNSILEARPKPGGRHSSGDCSSAWEVSTAGRNKASTGGPLGFPHNIHFWTAALCYAKWATK